MFSARTSFFFCTFNKRNQFLLLPFVKSSHPLKTTNSSIDSCMYGYCTSVYYCPLVVRSRTTRSSIISIELRGNRLQNLKNGERDPVCWFDTPGLNCQTTLRLPEALAGTLKMTYVGGPKPTMDVPMLYVLPSSS